MIINELTLAHFGKFHGKVVKFDSGLNILHGKNEAGKSTIHTFLYCMFFGMEGRRAANLYKQYEPWEDQGGYGGSLTFTSFGKRYRIERSFLKPDPWVKLFNGAYQHIAGEHDRDGVSQYGQPGADEGHV